MLPESEKQNNDGIDLVVDAAHDMELVRQSDGSIKRELILNPKRIWWQAHMVPYASFGHVAFSLEELLRQGKRTIHHMTKYRAEDAKQSIEDFYNSNRYGIDADSSISLRDKHNTKSTMLHLFTDRKIERAITLKGETKNSLWQSIVGRNEQERAAQS